MTIALPRTLIAALAIVATLSGSVLAADSFNAPIRLIVPAQPGGGTDTFARALAEQVAPLLRQAVKVENIDGGGGTLGVTHLVASRPDGMTLALVWNGPLTATPHSLMVPYSPDDYQPVMSIAYSSYVL